jgi:hypothetical protein
MKTSIRTYVIHYNLGNTTCAMKVMASSRRVAMNRFRDAMKHPPICPDGSPMWGSITTRKRQAPMQLAA